VSIGLGLPMFIRGMSERKGKLSISGRENSSSATFFSPTTPTHGSHLKHEVHVPSFTTMNVAFSFAWRMADMLARYGGKPISFRRPADAIVKSIARHSNES